MNPSRSCRYARRYRGASRPRLPEAEHATVVVGREAQIHDEYPAAGGANRRRQPAPGARAGEGFEAAYPRTYAPGMIAPAEPPVDRMRATFDLGRTIQPAHLTEAPVVGVHTPVDPAEMMALQMRIQKPAERQIEAVTVVVRLADEAQRLEGLRKFRSQRPEPQRLADGMQGSGEAHIALPARAELGQREAVHHVEVLVNADAGEDSRLSVRAKPAQYVSIVEAVVAEQCLRKW